MRTYAVYARYAVCNRIVSVYGYHMHVFSYLEKVYRCYTLNYKMLLSWQH
nr:MAG TPA: hypothetical protein [Bacteriophage sp.]DAY27347.1 MAG TPA: hypothetical protein [Caudoviricetes sp.]